MTKARKLAHIYFVVLTKELNLLHTADMLEVVWSQYMAAKANMYISKCSQSNSKVLASFLSVGGAQLQQDLSFLQK